MRIAFVGKGGSGKTTLSGLFAKFLNEQGVRVLAIDADINQHLAEMFNTDPQAAYLAHNQPELKALLAGIACGTSPSTYRSFV